MLLPCTRILNPPNENSYLEIVLPNLIVALRTSRTTTLQTEIQMNVYSVTSSVNNLHISACFDTLEQAFFMPLTMV